MSSSQRSCFILIASVLRISSQSVNYCPNSSYSRFNSLIIKPREGNLGIREDCRNDPDGCMKGLKCENLKCALDKDTCFYTLHLPRAVTVLPTCEEDGTFAAKQCRGDFITGRCFCYSAKGERIFGWDWWKNSEDMNCACSRKRFELHEKGEKGIMFHCQSNGNFEVLQCSQKICWCVDPVSGEIQNWIRAVPESWMKFLPCYKESEYGDQYLRKCDSVYFGMETINEALTLRGSSRALKTVEECDYDGGYGPTKVENAIVFCIWRDGTKIGTYSALLSEMDEPLGCNCARDKVFYQELGIEHSISCTPEGSYENLQEQNEQYFCIDRDGMAVTNLMTSYPDCNSFLYYMAN